MATTTHDWKRGVNQFSAATDDAYEFVCSRCGETAYVEAGRRGQAPRALPDGPCRRACQKFVGDDLACPAPAVARVIGRGWSWTACVTHAAWARSSIERIQETGLRGPGFAERVVPLREED